jgi:tetratricopeptide (TPR) repeat protein
MDSSNYSEMYKLVKKAKRYEKQGLHNKELEIYEIIHEKYLPNSSNLYKRPAILYEKKGEYNKSLELCKKAVELIEADKISGTKKTFEKKIEILNRKIKQTSTKPKEGKKHYPKISIAFLVIIIIFGGLFYYALNKENTYEDIQVDLSEMKRMSASSTDDNNNEPPAYPITETMISISRNIIGSEPEVINSVVISDNSAIGLGILVKEQTTYSDSKKLATTFIKALASAGAKEYDLSSPGISSFGELYDYYSVYVSVGTSNKSDDIILKAYKIKGGTEINFK